MNSILQKTETFVLNSLNEKLKSDYIYHTFLHTQYVVNKIKEIIKDESLSEDEIEIVLLAGWLHDIGYIIDKAKHESHSIDIATGFLMKEGYDENKIQQIAACINATKLNEIPTTLLQKIICDADFAHLASENYNKLANQLREEFENIGCGTYSNIEWMEENISVYKQHKYYTKYAILNWNIPKNENLISIKKELKKSGKKSQLKKETKNKSDRTVDTMFKVTISNHLKLSYIADKKANILLSVNAIILSIILTKLKLNFSDQTNEYLILPSIIFVVFGIVSIVLSVIVTRPSVTMGKFTQEDVENKKVNLLFFGNFHKMKLEEFKTAMNIVLNDKDYLYSSMTTDLYFLGQVLDKKYKILRWNYTVFMIGIITSVLAFVISYSLFNL
jgi:predicted metal-dependent HD superfamily phosphohydrolase